MIIPILLIINILILLTFIRFFIRRKKILIYLMRLEFLILYLFLRLILHLIYISHPLSFRIYILVIGACEARLGLRLLINISRFKGNDILTSASIKF